MTARLVARLYASPAALLTLAALFWGGNAVASRIAVGEIGPLTLVFLRWAPVVVALVWLTRADLAAHWPAARPRLGWIVVVGALGLTAFNALLYLAAYHTTAVNIGILQGALPVFTLIGAAVATGARVTARQAFGVAITLMGVALVATGGDPTALGAMTANRGDLYMLIACALYAGFTVALARRPAMPGAAFFALLAVVAAVTSAPLAAWELAHRLEAAPTLTGWMVVAYVAVFPSCLAQLFYLRGVDLIGPGAAGVYVNLVPVFAALLAVSIGGEPFAAYHAVALGLVLLGIRVAQRR